MTNLARILVFVALSILGLSISFLLTASSLLHYVVIYLSYPLLFLVFALFLLGAVKALRKDPVSRSLFRLTWQEGGIILATLFFILLFEDFGFKIIYDELILSTTAQMMHMDRLAGMPQFGNDLQGSYILLDAVLDKRPLVFPFLLSLVHDLSGYRYQNVFVLNGLLTVALLYLAYVFSRTLSGKKYGVLSLLLLVNLPLLAIFANSGHFEILNLVGLLFTLIWGYIYIRKPNGVNLIPFVLSLTLLSQVRYENSLYILPFGILILLGWWRKREIIMPWQVIITPLFFVLYAMHYRLIFGKEDTFQAGPNGRVDTFSLSYIPENLTSAVDYLFAIGQDSSNSLLVSIIGFTAVFFFLAYALRKGPDLSGRNPKGTIMFFFLMAITLFCLVISVFNFGVFNNYVTNRLSLPLYLFLIITAPFIIKRYQKKYLVGLLLFTLLSGVAAVFFMTPSALAAKGIHYVLGILSVTVLLFWVWKRWTSTAYGLGMICIVYFLMVTMPIAHTGRYAQSYKPVMTIQFEQQFLSSLPEHEKVLWITPPPYVAILNEVATISPARIFEDPDSLKRHFRDINYTRVFLAGTWKRNEEGKFDHLNEEDSIEFDTDSFEIETYRDYPIIGSIIYRIQEVKLKPSPEEELVE